MLSKRAIAWAQLPQWHGRQNLYHPTNNPEGIVSFGNAENFLMHDEISKFVNAKAHFDKSCFAYGEGFTGTVRLRTAMANHLNAHFNPAKQFDPEEITFAAGVTALSDACALITCNPDASEAILLGKPGYGGFTKDLAMRTGAHLEYASFEDEDQFASSSVAAYETSYAQAEARGITIKAIVICNPHNPLGRCYSRETLGALLRFCAAKRIHLISDEIFALSTYKRPDRPSELFTSVRSIDLDGIIDPAQVHVLYGLSKDFGSCGMRLGCLISQNVEFTKAARSNCHFCAPSQFSMEIATKILEDGAFVSGYLHTASNVLLQSRLLAETLLERAAITYYNKGNAGMFVWLDLRRHLPIREAEGDGWDAEYLLAQRFRSGGVLMSTGKQYAASEPGYFRLIHCVPEVWLRKGIERIVTVLESKS